MEALRILNGEHGSLEWQSLIGFWKVNELLGSMCKILIELWPQRTSSATIWYCRWNFLSCFDASHLERETVRRLWKSID